MSPGSGSHAVGLDMGISPGQALDFCLSLRKRPFPVFFLLLPLKIQTGRKRCGGKVGKEIKQREKQG